LKAYILKWKFILYHTSDMAGRFRVVSEAVLAPAPVPVPEPVTPAPIQADIGAATNPIPIAVDEPDEDDEKPPLGKVPRRDGRHTDPADPERRSYENPEGRYDANWLRERLNRIRRANSDPYYKLAVGVASGSGRTVLELVADVVPPPVDPAEAALDAVVAALPRPLQQPQPQPQSTPLRASGSPAKPEPLDEYDTELYVPPPVRPESAPNVRVNARWVNRPENLGELVFNETMQGALDRSMADIQQWCGIYNVSLHQFVISPLVQTFFYDLVAANLRIKEIGAPRRNEQPRTLMPLKKRERLNALLMLKQTRVNPYDPHGVVGIEGQMHTLITGGHKRRALTRDEGLHHPSLSYAERRVYVRTGRDQLELDQDEEFTRLAL